MKFVLIVINKPEDEADDEEAADEVESAVRLDPIGIAEVAALFAVLVEPVDMG